MKIKATVLLVVIIVVVGLLGGCAAVDTTTSTAGQEQEIQAEEPVEAVRLPSVQVAPLGVLLKDKQNVLFAGVGFAPNSEINVYITMGGVSSNISYQLGNPVTNEEGAFSGVWELNKGEVSMIEPGVHNVPVFVEGGDRVNVPLVFIKEEKME